MRFEIDTSQAKTMATRLQSFLSANPQERLTRSSAIEAVARMLGFNNRNEMLGRLDEAPAPLAHPVPPEGGTLDIDRGRQALDNLRGVLEGARQSCALRLVEEGRKVLPEGDFMTAMHGGSLFGNHALIVVEDRIAHDLDADLRLMKLLHAALVVHSEEMEWAMDCRRSRAAQIAYALVNESISIAEAMWVAHQSLDEEMAQQH